MTEIPVMPCHICGSAAVTVIPRYSAFHRVTSDCKPWPPGGKLAVCGDCGCAQAVLDAAWHGEAKRIYDAYTIYHQSKGVEQSVFDQASGAAVSRSSRLLKRLQAEVSLPGKGRVLDVGCGNGALLRAFNAANPDWVLAGVEVNDHYRAVVEAIPGVERLYTCPVTEVPGRFQLISLMHALEHIPSPREFVGRLWDKLEEGGLLVVQVPDCAQNPFMFLVADHATHFFPATARAVVAGAGYEVLAVADNWVAKEITVVARKGAERGGKEPSRPPGDPISPIAARLGWLSEQVATVRDLARRGPLGIFGTSIAATWLFAELEEKVAFFVDEDPHRAGQSCFGRPIHRPSEAPAGGAVFMALPPVLASGVRQRLEAAGVRLHFTVPGPLPSV